MHDRGGVFASQSSSDRPKLFLMNRIMNKVTIHIRNRRRKNSRITIGRIKPCVSVSSPMYADIIQMRFMKNLNVMMKIPAHIATIIGQTNFHRIKDRQFGILFSFPPALAALPDRSFFRTGFLGDLKE